MAIVRLEHVSKTYLKGSEGLKVLVNIDLDIQEGEFVAFMGPSGSGKTTLLNLIGGIDRPTDGVVRIDDQDLSHLSKRQLANWRSSTIGFVFQFYNLLPFLSAQRNVELPLLLTKLGKKQRQNNALTALKTVGLEDRAKHKPGELSGGQQQRVAIARAIVADPRILICDEPTGDLDRSNADEILDLLMLMNRRFGKTIVMVTHDPRAADHAQRILNLDKGNFVGEAA